MGNQTLGQILAPTRKSATTSLQLEDGSRIGVIGGGPAGSFFSYFILELAQRLGKEFEVDIYEPRNFSQPGPLGCNMCGGIISESLVQMLAAEGIDLPPSVIQRGIDSYVLHMDVGSVRIDTPLHEKRIGAVYRGPGPRDLKEIKWGSFDGHLQQLAMKNGAHVIQKRVSEVHWDDGRPQLKTRGGSPQTYDLLAVSVGVNSAAVKLFKNLGLGYQPPQTTKTFIREYFLGEERVGDLLGSSMHVFLLDIPRLEFAALIPKGDYVTLCLLGEEIDKELVETFLNTPEVAHCLPDELRTAPGSCQCSPRISIGAARHPFADRVVFIGDSGVTRLYKDGIGAAYRTSKAAATTAIFKGVSAADFKRYYWPACRKIQTDNAIGKFVFFVTRQIQQRRFARRAVLRMTTGEQQRAGRLRRMSMVLWDTFTGSASYREILMRTLHPAYLLRFGKNLIVSLLQVNAKRAEDRPPDQQEQHATGALGKIYQPGDVLIRQGEVSEGLLVILEGQVALMREQRGQEMFLGVRSAGEVLGETAVLEKETQMATVVAVSPVRVLTVDRENFMRRINEDPSLANRLFQLMSRRIRELNQEVAVLSREIDRLTERTSPPNKMETA